MTAKEKAEQERLKKMKGWTRKDFDFYVDFLKKVFPGVNVGNTLEDFEKFKAELNKK